MCALCQRKKYTLLQWLTKSDNRNSSPAGGTFPSSGYLVCLALQFYTVSKNDSLV